MIHPGAAFEPDGLEEMIMPPLSRYPKDFLIVALLIMLSGMYSFYVNVMAGIRNIHLFDSLIMVLPWVLIPLVIGRGLLCLFEGYRRIALSLLYLYVALMVVVAPQIMRQSQAFEHLLYVFGFLLLAWMIYVLHRPGVRELFARANARRRELDEEERMSEKSNLVKEPL